MLLITPDFLASDYCSGKEVTTALHRHAINDARVIPIIVRAVDWVGSEFSRLQVLPKDEKPVTSCENQDEAWMEVAICIRAVVQDILKKRVARYVRRSNNRGPIQPDRETTEMSPLG